MSLLRISNYPFSCVAATAHRDRNNNNDAVTQRSESSRFSYKTEAEELYSPYNPLWKEEQIYTGERRGPILAPDTDRSSSSNILGRMSNSQPAHYPLDPHIFEFDDTSSTVMSRERYGHRRQQQQQRKRHPKYDLKETTVIPAAGSGFPLQSADISGNDNKSNDFHSGRDKKRVFGSDRRRKWILPINFRRQKGRLNIRFDKAENFDQSRSRRRSEERNEDSSPMINEKSTAVTAATPSNGTKTEYESLHSPDHTALIPAYHKSSSTRIPDKQHQKIPQISLSLDPFSIVTLLQKGLKSVICVASVYVGTQKILGQMIVVKQCLATVDYISQHGNYGRRVRKSEIKRLRIFENSCQGDAIVAARAVTRIILQIFYMSCAGKSVAFVLDMTPCLLKPPWICQWWYGVVWLSSIYAIEWVCQEQLYFCQAQTQNRIHSFVSIQPLIQKKRQREIYSVSRVRERRNRDPKELANNLFRIISRRGNKNEFDCSIKLMADSEDVPNIQLNPLLFPSTWKPLSVITFVALSRAIYRGFCVNESSSGHLDELVGVACREKNQYYIMRSFIIQKALYSEWLRVLVQERRIALGASISVIGLLALIRSIHSIATVDRFAAMAMILVLMSRMVSSWMNILLTYKGFNL